MSDRVMVFLDYQNVYMAARHAFYPSPAAIPHWEGQVDPLALGQLLVERSPFDRALIGVQIYRGVPDSTKDPKGYGACVRSLLDHDRKKFESSLDHCDTRTAGQVRRPRRKASTFPSLPTSC